MDSILDSILDTQGIFMMDYELRLIGLKFATHSRGFPPKKGPVNFVGWLLIETPVFWPFSAARTQRTLEKIGELPRMTKEEGTLTLAVCWLYPICFLRNPTAREPKARHAQLSMQPVSKAAAASSFQWQWVWAYGFTNYCNGSFFTTNIGITSGQ